MFGRPARDSGLLSERNDRPTESQRLHLLNSTDIKTRIERGPALVALFRRAKGDPGRAVESLYLTILSRPPTEAEKDVSTKYVRSMRLPPRQAAQDLVWALINSKEFLYRQ